MAALVAAIQSGLEWAVFSAGLFGGNPVAVELQRPLTLAWYFGIAALTAAVVHQDPIPGVDQDWLIRPLRRRDLLLAKCLFSALTICVPMFLLDVALGLALGFPWALTLEAMLFKEIFVFAFLIVPLLAMAAGTRNLTEFAVLAAAMMVTYAASSALGALVLGPNRCPTCGTGFSWLEHLWQHLMMLAGAAVILTLQFRGRRTQASRALAVGGVAALAFIQVPWSLAFAVQQRLEGRAMADGVAMAIVPGTTGADDGNGANHRSVDGRQATRALLQGDVERAIEVIRRRHERADPPVPVKFQMRIDGLLPHELLLVDRVESQVVGGDGRVLYRNVMVGPGDTVGEPSLVTQAVDIPTSVRRQAAAHPASLHLHYALTVMKEISSFDIAADDGEARSHDMGVCGTKADQDGISLRCKQMGATPFCYSAIVYGPEGRHNPQVMKCTPDYRPYVPGFTNALGYAGLDLPLRDRYGLARYPVDASDLPRSHLVVTVYAVRGRFGQTLSAPLGDQ